jgi:phosphatidate cytidylyltransferase
MSNNTGKRTLVALIAIPFLLAVSYYGGIPFLLFSLLIGLVANYEFLKMSTVKEIFANGIISSLMIILLVLNTYYLVLYRNKASAINNLGATFLGVFYIGLFSSSLVAIREFYQNPLEYDQGGLIIIAILFTIWICDSAAYFLGLAYGKHRLFLRVSPKKSWEGAIAGFVFSIIAMIAAKVIIIDFLSWVDVIAIGFIVGIIGQYGDLVESLIKRDAGVKDSSAIIPGHGGIFDRFDSLLFAAPFVYLYLKYLSQ